MFINFRVNIHYVQYLKSGPYTVFPVISFVLTCRTIKPEKRIEQCV